MLSALAEFFPCEFTVLLAILISSERSQQNLKSSILSLERARLQSKRRNHTIVKFWALYDVGGRDILEMSFWHPSVACQNTQSLLQAHIQQWIVCNYRNSSSINSLFLSLIAPKWIINWELPLIYIFVGLIINTCDPIDTPIDQEIFFFVHQALSP